MSRSSLTQKRRRKLIPQKEIVRARNRTSRKLRTANFEERGLEMKSGVRNLFPEHGSPWKLLSGKGIIRSVFEKDPLTGRQTIPPEITLWVWQQTCDEQVWLGKWLRVWTRISLENKAAKWKPDKGLKGMGEAQEDTSVYPRLPRTLKSIHHSSRHIHSPRPSSAVRSQKHTCGLEGPHRVRTWNPDTVWVFTFCFSGATFCVKVILKTQPSTRWLCF